MNGEDDDCDDVGGVAGDAGAAVRPCLRALGEPFGVLVPPGIGMYTPRSTVGKKKAKALLSNSSDATNKNKKQKMVAVLANEKIIAQRSDSLAVLIAETKKKNVLAEQHFAYQFFREQPDTVEAKEFFKAMSKKYSNYIVEQEVPAVPASLESTPEESTTLEDADVDIVQIVETEEDEDYENDVGDVGENFESRGLLVPAGGFSRDHALDKAAAAACARPIIDVTKLTGSDFSQDSEYIRWNGNGTPPSLPCTKKLVAALQRNENIELVVDSDENIELVVDSQMTTLD